MKVAILTHQLYTNYGGILQNYALQVALRKLGVDAETLDYYKGLPLKSKFLSVGKRVLLYILGRNIIVKAWPSRSERKIIAANTRRFVAKYIKTTPVFSFSQLKHYPYERYDTVIVGSDQVWRPRYVGAVEVFFLSSCVGKRIKRIAYAASFGVEYWEFSRRQTKKCAYLAQYFDAISVREDFGVDMCRQNLGVEAKHVLDPTMLLNAVDYERLVLAEHEETSGQKKMMTYLLDPTDDKWLIVQSVCQKKHIEPNVIVPKRKFEEVGSKGLLQCVFPPITTWLKGFMDAEFVVTDSFHGMVFSVIFNKPFVVIGNKQRGMSRFRSLLSMLELEDRLIITSSELSEHHFSPIDYVRVNIIIEQKREESFAFLRNALFQS